MRIGFYGAEVTCTIAKVYLFKRGIILRHLKVRIRFHRTGVADPDSFECGSGSIILVDSGSMEQKSFVCDRLPGCTRVGAIFQRDLWEK